MFYNINNKIVTIHMYSDVYVLNVYLTAISTNCGLHWKYTKYAMVPLFV